mmetsp:Transcript_27846/g.34876  ORF Transcript_27846/g.34876 Transcript_27846/m.34876 type:complete len:254 (+) Transcript_27846:143-904(+)
MGRVRRYKKLKSCDPFAPKKRLNDDKHDLPPLKTDEDDFDFQELGFTKESKTKDKRKRRLEKKWEAEALKNDNYIKQLEAQSKSHSNKNVSGRITGKLATESVRDFKKRVQQDTARLLIEDSKAASSSRQKKKRYLENRRKKRKKMRMQDEAVEDDEFPRVVDAPVGFGETNDAPPTFKMVPKLKPGKQKQKANKLALLTSKDQEGGGSKLNEGEKARNQKQMEALRQQVLQAYSDVKKKRRGGATKFAAGNL